MDSRLLQLDEGNFSLGSHQTGLRTLYFCSPHIVDSAIIIGMYGTVFLVR